MRVDTIQQAASAQSGGFADGFAGSLAGEVAQETADAAASESRALVVTATPAAAPTVPVYRQAAFLAQLIATKDKLPQTRTKRRAEPSEAIAAYQFANTLTRL
jgi:hypothetical protein